MPGRKAVPHRVDSQQDLQQEPGEATPTYKPYRQEYADTLERARKNDRRTHRIVGGNIFGRSSADGGVDVSDFSSGCVQLSEGIDTSTSTSMLATGQAQAQAVPQSTHQARSDAPAHARVEAASRLPARARHEASPQAPHQASVRVSAQKSSRSNTHSPSMQIPRKPLPAPHDPTHTPSPSTLTLTPTPIPPTSPAIVDILAFDSPSSSHIVGINGIPFRKDVARDSMNSNAFIDAGQLNDDVPVHLLRYIENPRSKLEYFKNSVREFVHR